MDFERVFQRLYPALFRYLHRLTGDPDAAHDIAQESFLRLLRQELPEKEIRPWLFTVATNLVRDAARSTERRRRLLSGASLAIATPPRPDDVVEQREQIGLVRDVLDQLAERDRQLLMLREEGFSYKEIAGIVGVAPGSVGTLIARALKKFTELYESSETRE
ncbi:MAG: sigma-70 family RNA polymerase sigma factor [Longimicrobiales bacterium]